MVEDLETWQELNFKTQFSAMGSSVLETGWLGAGIPSVYIPQPKGATRDLISQGTILLASIPLSHLLEESLLATCSCGRSTRRSITKIYIPQVLATCGDQIQLFRDWHMGRWKLSRQLSGIRSCPSTAESVEGDWVLRFQGLEGHAAVE